MTQQEIIDMAREVCLASWHKDLKKWVVDHGLGRFADLVEAKAEAKEREACAVLCENMDEMSYPTRVIFPSECAAAIRARK